MCVPGSLILRGIQSNAAILGQSRANAVLMNGATAIAGEQPRAVVRKRNRLQLVELIDAVNLTTRANIKEKDFVVLATRCDPASVARKRNAHHGCTVPLEPLQPLLTGKIPNERHLVCPGRRQLLATRR